MGNTAPCNNFQIDVKAIEFGVCIFCGHKEKDHEATKTFEKKETFQCNI